MIKGRGYEANRQDQPILYWWTFAISVVAVGIGAILGLGAVAAIAFIAASANWSTVGWW